MSISDHFLSNFERRIQNLLIPYDFGEPSYLIKNANDILEKWDAEPREPQSTNLDSLCSRVQNDDYPNIKGKERKWLPWIIFYGDAPRLVESQEKLKFILNFLSNPFRKTYLKGLIHTYLSNYDPTSSGCELIRKFIWDRLTGFDQERILPSLKFWVENKQPFFLPNGHQQTANLFIGGSEDINNVLSKYGFDKSLATSKFIRNVIISIIEKTKNRFPDHLEKCLFVNEIPGPPRKPKFKDLVLKTASNLLPKAGVFADVEVKERLSSYFLRYLKDPRIPGNEIHWRGVDEKSKIIFCQWLSSKDLEFFFNIVDETSSDTNWEYRRIFWEAYLPHIENTWVILGRRARDIAKEVDSGQFHLTHNRFGELLGGNSRQSVFLIQLGGFVFVEWNDSGACRVYDFDQCPFKFGQPEYSAYNLRADNFIEKIVHRSPETYKWQIKLRNWIRDNTSIFIEENEYKL